MVFLCRSVDDSFSVANSTNPILQQLFGDKNGKRIIEK
jgi:hypothetical protein